MQTRQQPTEIAPHYFGMAHPEGLHRPRDIKDGTSQTGTAAGIAGQWVSQNFQTMQSAKMLLMSA